LATITRYRFDTARSRFTVQAFTSGLFSFLGAEPTFNIREFEGGVWFEDDLIANLRMELTVCGRSLPLPDGFRPEGDMSHSGFPDIRYEAAAAIAEKVRPGHYRLGLDGVLALRDEARAHRSVVDLVLMETGLRLKGQTRVRMSDFGIPPVAALGGAIRLKDEVVLSFDLDARPDEG
jgi:hypothetical protein